MPLYGVQAQVGLAEAYPAVVRLAVIAWLDAELDGLVEFSGDAQRELTVFVTSRLGLFGEHDICPRTCYQGKMEQQEPTLIHRRCWNRLSSGSGRGQPRAFGYRVDFGPHLALVVRLPAGFFFSHHSRPWSSTRCSHSPVISVGTRSM